MVPAMTVKFWGVRGSHPVSAAEVSHYGGNTPSIEVNIPGLVIVLDAGTGIIPLGQDLLQRRKGKSAAPPIVLLLSHLHHDHIQGLPFFAPAFDSSTRLYIYGPAYKDQDLEKTLEVTMSPPFFPISLDSMVARRTIENLQEGQVIDLPPSEFKPQTAAASDRPVDEDTLRIRSYRSDAHPDSVFIFRLEWRGRSVVYATDIEEMDEVDPDLVRFIADCDLLIHDTQYTEEHYHGQLPERPATAGFGHSTAEMACRVARAAGAARLALFHYEPSYSDQDVTSLEARARKCFADTFAAREGLSVVFPALGPVDMAVRGAARPVLFHQPYIKRQD